MTVRSRRFAQLVDPGDDTFRTLYTVPSGRTAVVRCLEACNQASAARIITIAINVGSTGRILSQKTISANDVYVWPGYLVLNPADALLVRVQAGTNSIVWGAFGTLLLGEPE